MAPHATLTLSVRGVLRTRGGFIITVTHKGLQFPLHFTVDDRTVHDWFDHDEFQKNKIEFNSLRFHNTFNYLSRGSSVLRGGRADPRICDYDSLCGSPQESLLVFVPFSARNGRFTPADKGAGVHVCNRFTVLSRSVGQCSAVPSSRVLLHGWAE